MTLSLFFLSFLFLFGCSKTDSLKDIKKVSIKNENGNYTLYRNGKPFIIKGAGGYENLELLAAAGGNAIRIWDTTNLEVILKKAEKNNLAVVVGLPMPECSEMAFYNDTSNTSHQYYSFKNIINKYKNHSAVLMWCVGNELGFPLNFSHINFYRQFNKIVRMIHKDDPDHPVTTTLKNFENKTIISIKIRTDIDVISFNTFGRLSYLRNDLKQFSWFWNGPYMVTEWGIDGPWEGTAQTAWGAYIEPSSNDKAEQYLSRYKNSMPLEDPRFLGSFIFYWGKKQETTHTWFSLFDESGAQNEVVTVAKYIWSGKKNANEFPKIKRMLINGLFSSDNLIEEANTLVSAELELLNYDVNISRVHWDIFPEDWHKNNNKDKVKKLEPIKGLNISATGLKVKFLTPKKEGPYRVFATIYDKHGNIATCNTPFYVVKTK